MDWDFSFFSFLFFNDPKCREQLTLVNSQPPVVTDWVLWVTEQLGVAGMAQSSAWKLAGQRKSPRWLASSLSGVRSVSSGRCRRWRLLGGFQPVPRGPQHAWVCTLWPEHEAPPFWGAGLLHSLLLSWVPNLQADQELQQLQRPSALAPAQINSQRSRRLASKQQLG